MERGTCGASNWHRGSNVLKSECYIQIVSHINKILHYSMFLFRAFLVQKSILSR